jgi:hypothetical protein
LSKNRKYNNAKEVYLALDTMVNIAIRLLTLFLLRVDYCFVSVFCAISLNLIHVIIFLLHFVFRSFLVFVFCFTFIVHAFD